MIHMIKEMHTIEGIKEMERDKNIDNIDKIEEEKNGKNNEKNKNEKIEKEKIEFTQEKEFQKIKKEIEEFCKQHKLYENIKKTNGNIVIGKGQRNPKALFIGEAPGFEENKQGKPFVGRSGQVLDKWIKELEINQEYAIINTVPMIPLDEEGKIRKPTEKEITEFKEILNKLIEYLKPETMIIVGRSAEKALNEKMKNCEAKKKNDKIISFTYHPAYYLRRGQTGIIEIKEMKKNIEKEKTKTEKQQQKGIMDWFK